MTLLLLSVACGNENQIIDTNPVSEAAEAESLEECHEPTISLSCPEPVINLSCPDPVISVQVAAPEVQVDVAAPEVSVTVEGPDMSGVASAVDELSTSMSNAVAGVYDQFLYSGTLLTYDPTQIFVNDTLEKAMVQSIHGPGWSLECWLEYTDGSTVDMFTHAGTVYHSVTLNPGDSIWCQVASEAEIPQSWYILSGYWY
jgi:hypothetical protein